MNETRKFGGSPVRFRLEVALAVIGAALFALTLVFPEWIEELTGIEPDNGSGAAEFVVAGIFLLTAVVSGVMARRTYLRRASA